MTGQDLHRNAASAAAYARAPYRWYVMGVLIAAYTCHAMDRGLPGILMEPIRAEFHLKDSQLGLITGTGYGVAFGLAVIPMGLLSDRMARRSLLSAVLAIWSACTALAGFATAPGMLVAARMGVGAAEAGALPTGMPLLGDIFPARQRPMAMGVFYIHANLGAFLASAVGGLVAAAYGWRMAFLAVGIPGLLVALLLRLTVREPIRGGQEPPGPDGAPASQRPATLSAAAAYVGHNPALICLIAATMLVSLVSITMGTWTAPFLMRVHHLGLKETGLIMGVGAALCGACSPPLFGFLASRLSARDPAWTLRLVWLCLIGALVCGMTMLFVAQTALSIAAYVGCVFLYSAFPALTFAEVTTHSPAPMRGTIMSFVQLAAVLVGYGVGPFVTGLLSDLYGGGAAIRYAMANSIALYVLVIPLYMAANRRLYGRTP